MPRPASGSTLASECQAKLPKGFCTGIGPSRKRPRGAESAPEWGIAAWTRHLRRPGCLAIVAWAVATWPGLTLASGVGKMPSYGGPDAKAIPDILDSLRAKGTVSDSDGPKKPNIVFIFIDDMGWNDIGYHSTDVAQLTPNLDALAADGVKLTNYYSMHLCTPARAALMTGRYPIRYGMQFSVIQPTSPWGLKLSEKLLPEYLSSVGYETHMTGKWHLGSFARAYIPSERGFSTFMGYLNDEQDYYTHQAYSTTFNGRMFFDFGYGDADGYVNACNRSDVEGRHNMIGQYSTNVFTDRALEVIEQHDPTDEDHPLFLYISYQAMHSPLGPPPDADLTDDDLLLIDNLAVTNARRTRFARVLLHLDKSIARVVRALDDTGHLDNTIIVVASDNGGCPFHGGSNFPLRGMKHTYFEGGFKVPAFIWSSSHLPDYLTGTTYNHMMHVTDWLPTLARVGKYEVNMTELDGVDHWNAIVTNSSVAPRETLLYNFDVYQVHKSSLSTHPPKGAVRVGRWKLIMSEWCEGYHSWGANDSYNTNVCSERNSCWRQACGATCISHPQVLAGNYLFDLESDPIEEHNMLDVFPGLVEELSRQFMELSNGWVDSAWESTDSDAYAVWTRSGDWMAPWDKIDTELDDEL